MKWFNWLKNKETARREPFPDCVVEEKVRAFISTKSKILRSNEITLEMKLFTTGALDSLTFVQLVAFLETEFQITLADHTEVTGDKLDTLSQIIRAVQTSR